MNALNRICILPHILSCLRHPVYLPFFLILKISSSFIYLFTLLQEKIIKAPNLINCCIIFFTLDLKMDTHLLLVMKLSLNVFLYVLHFHPCPPQLLSSTQWTHVCFLHQSSVPHQRWSNRWKHPSSKYVIFGIDWDFLKGETTFTFSIIQKT